MQRKMIWFVIAAALLICAYIIIPWSLNVKEREYRRYSTFATVGERIAAYLRSHRSEVSTTLDGFVSLGVISQADMAILRKNSVSYHPPKADAMEDAVILRYPISTDTDLAILLSGQARFFQKGSRGKR